MTTLTFVIGIVALVMLIICTAVVSYAAGKKRAAVEIMAIVKPAVDAVQKVLKASMQNAPKSENAPMKEEDDV